MTAAEPMSSERLVTLPGHFHGFALMHIAMRRDAGRLAAVARATHFARPDGIGAWWHALRGVIDWHHHSEDEILWPELRRSVPSFAVAADALDGDHARLDEAMDTIGAALASGAAGAALVPAADAFTDILQRHLATEEHIVFPAFTQLGEQRYLALERRLLRTAPPRVLGHLQPWMFDGADPGAAAHVAASIPPPVRLLGRTVLRRRYERLLAPVVARTVPAQRPKEKR
ncbi:hemerythrin domain-containing protein [Streptomyces sp. NBC_00859]|uniref:hemerythrin domain-containing protein n=1 Tax=Streptomyces sp. NBC_00859 TaxID=2903682 RepID=UPI003865F9FC|nr:hemerythrin domain-containing protein [Streptomyces sp. NBC_00859]